VVSDPLKLRAAVPERYSAVFKVGEDATVRVEAWKERTFEGKVARVNPWVDPANRTFGVEVLVPNHDGALRPGSFARGDILVGKEPALFAPEDAVVSFAGVTKVFVVKDGKARAVAVQAGERRKGFLEVRGVDAGDQVVTRGQSVLSDGAAVAVEEPKK
jgi:RND family efflux transporter MFP subunit